MMKTIAAIAATGAAALATANAAAVYEFNVIDGNIVGTLSGTIDVNGAEVSSDGTLGTGIFFGSPAGILQIADADPEPATSYSITGPGSFSTGAGMLPMGATFTGSELFLNSGDTFTLPDDQLVGGVATMVGTFFLEGMDFEDLGIIVGSYTYTLTNGDTFTLVFNDMVAPVPVPGALALFVPAIAGGVIARRRRKA